MISKSTIKLIQSLKHKKYRQKYDLFIAEGIKTVSTLIQGASYELDAIYATESATLRLPDHRMTVDIVGHQELAKLSFQQSGADVVAVFKIGDGHAWDMHGIHKMLYLDDVQDPGNVGTIIRIADWYGIDAVVRSPQSADFYNPKVVQSTMGSLAGVRLYTMDQDQWSELPDNYVVTSQMEGDGTVAPHDHGCLSLVIGNEGHGASALLLTRSDCAYSIAGSPDRLAESLNASAATAIMVDRIFGGL